MFGTGIGLGTRLTAPVPGLVAGLPLAGAAKMGAATRRARKRNAWMRRILVVWFDVQQGVGLDEMLIS